MTKEPLNNVNKTGKDAKGKFTSENNKGRPVGTKNKRPSFCKLLGEQRTKEALEMLWNHAIGGDIQALNILIDRIYPKLSSAKTETITEFDFGSTTTLNETIEAINKVTDALSDGTLTHEQADYLTNHLKMKHDMFENREFREKFTLVLNEMKNVPELQMYCDNSLAFQHLTRDTKTIN